MPMAPRPMAETRRPWPRVRVCIRYLLQSSWLLRGYQPERGGPDGRGHHGLDVGAALAPGLAAGGGVDLVVDGGVGLVGEGDVLADPVGLDAALVAFARVAIPGTASASVGADVKVVAGADNPDRHRVARRAIESERRDLQLSRARDRAEFVAGPYGHQQSS